MRIAPNGHPFGNKYFLLLVGQPVVTDWSLYLDRDISPVCPAPIQSAVATATPGPGPLLIQQGFWEQFCEQEVQVP